jgi:hypothetical protein
MHMAATLRPRIRSSFLKHASVSTSRPGGSKTSTLRDELIRGLRADYRRTCLAVYAYAHCAEQIPFQDDDTLENVLTLRGVQQVLNGLVIVEIRGQLGDAAPLPLEEEQALHAIRWVAQPGWHERTATALRRHALQCQSLGEAELAKRLRRLADAEDALVPLGTYFPACPAAS